MIKELDIKNAEIALNILNVQIPSYTIEAEIIGYLDIPPLRDTVESLQHCGELFFGYFINGELSGAVSVKFVDEVLDIHRLIVHPQHFRKGIAQQLLKYIETVFDYKKIIVSTGSKNTPAVSFYERNGFRKVATTRLNDQLSIDHFEKLRK